MTVLEKLPTVGAGDAGAAVRTGAWRAVGIDGSDRHGAAAVSQQGESDLALIAQRARRRVRCVRSVARARIQLTGAGEQISLTAQIHVAPRASISEAVERVVEDLIAGIEADLGFPLAEQRVEFSRHRLGLARSGGDSPLLTIV